MPTNTARESAKRLGLHHVIGFLRRKNNTLLAFMVHENARRLALNVRPVLEGTTKSR